MHINDNVNLKRIEFLVTKRCNANCRHCSVPVDPDCRDDRYWDVETVKASFRYLLDHYDILSVMAYGGEPILRIDDVVELFAIASDRRVPVIDLITSGYISKTASKEEVRAVVDKLSESGIKRILLSVDAFHQERIPLEKVEWFVGRTSELGFCQILLHPAWIVSRGDDNPYNVRTDEILEKLSGKYGIGVSEGNIIVPSGRNRSNIGEYYQSVRHDLDKKCGSIPHTNPLDRVGTIRILPNGAVNICRGITIGNIFAQSIGSILESYSPAKTPMASLMHAEGIRGLYNLALRNGAEIRQDEYYGLCDLCASCMSFLKSKGYDEC